MQLDVNVEGSAAPNSQEAQRRSLKTLEGMDLLLQEQERSVQQELCRELSGDAAAEAESGENKNGDEDDASRHDDGEGENASGDDIGEAQNEENADGGICILMKGGNDAEIKNFFRRDRWPHRCRIHASFIKQ